MAAVLEFRNQAELSESDIATVADMLRLTARQSLPQAKYLVMTRENIVKLLPPGRSLESCSDAECEVEVGRRWTPNCEKLFQVAPTGLLLTGEDWLGGNDAAGVL